MVKEYSNDEITVFWDHTKCIHSENCVKGLPGVFRPTERPWINIEEATAEDLHATVSKCPSGALKSELKGQSTSTNMSRETTKVEVLKNGPVLVHGECEITNSDGSTEQKSGVTALCRCGASSNKPYCDGTHNSNGFEG